MLAHKRSYMLFCNLCDISGLGLDLFSKSFPDYLLDIN